MAWTTPKTWAVGEVLTAANMNLHLRDNLNALAGFFVPINHEGTGANLGFAANEAWASRFIVPGPFAVTTVEIEIVTSAGNIDVGLFSDAAGATPTLTRVWSRGAIASPGSGDQSISISGGSPTSLTVTPGSYWLAVSSDSGSFVLLTSNDVPKGGALTKTASHPLPASITTPTVANTGPRGILL